MADTNKEYSSSLSTQSSEHPIKESKRSKSPSIFHILGHKKSSEKKEESIPPRLQEAIAEMEERKARKLEEMQKEGKTPNNKTRGGSSETAVGALGALAQVLS